jgi:hypothetical protein
MRSFFVALMPAASVVIGSACGSDSNTGPAPEQFVASLASLSERPTIVPGSGTGTATFAMSSDQITFTIDVSSLDSVTAAHIHAGGTAVAGPVMITLFTNTGTGTVNGRLTDGTIKAADLPAGVSFDSLKALMKAGNVYVNVHTKAFPAGVMRGQLLPPGQAPPPERFDAILTGANERPNPTTSTATGTAAFEVSGNSVKFTINVAGITDATAAHIHNGSGTVAAGVAVGLFANAAGTGALTGNLTSGTFTASNIGIATISLDSLLVLMRTKNAYVNVHTKTNPGGEIRGQLSGATTVTIP